MKNVNSVNKNIIEIVNHMLIGGGGLEKPYKIRAYKEFETISIDKISSNR